jgi:4'-phosphopantetheinyl transferase
MPALPLAPDDAHSTFGLGLTDVHVWHVDLGGADWRNLPDFLHRDEREKMKRFRTSRLQQRYQRCRSALRIILGGYLRRDPAEIVFDYRLFGKPELACEPLCFNVSHSGNRALIALSRHRLGVDLETILDRRIDIAAMLPDVCHPTEVAALAAQCETDSAPFYQLWTRKEAYCKAIGRGLQRSLQALRFEELGSGTAAVIDESANAGPAYFVHQLDIQSEFAASVCVTLNAPQFRHLLFTTRRLR